MSSASTTGQRDGGTAPSSPGELQLFIDGESRVGGGDVLESVNPFTQQVWAQLAQASVADVGDAVSAAVAAARSWNRSTGLQRVTLLNRLADLIDAHGDELAEIESTDNGKIIRETRSQMRFAARNYRFFAGIADKLVGETKPLDNPLTFDYTLREPVGVAALITPWNSPIAILANKLAPALAAGNTVVIKPSEFTSASTLRFAELSREAGFPAGVVNVVVGGPDVGEALTTDPRLGRVSFTGSVNVGRIIARQAAENIVPVTLELGGKSANIIFGDAELERAIPGSVAGIFAAAGQTCIAGSRLIVHRSVYEEVLAGIKEIVKGVSFGDPLDPGTDMGPVAHRGQWEAILAFIDQAEASGARLVTGGRAATEQIGDLYVAPTVFADVDPKSDLAQNEVFGPVLAVIPFQTDEQAIEIANDSVYGLASGMWTTSVRRVHSLAPRIRAGSVWVNTYRTNAAQAPFGGTGHSGYGRERGVEALLEYTRYKNVMVDLSTEARDPFTIRV